MNIVAMYLRKSRADAEAEKEGQFETLAHHKQILEEYNNIHIIMTLKCP